MHFLGASGIGEILANSLAARNVIVVVLDVNPIVTDNGKQTLGPKKLADPLFR